MKKVYKLAGAAVVGLIALGAAGTSGDDPAASAPAPVSPSVRVLERPAAPPATSAKPTTFYGFSAALKAQIDKAAAQRDCEALQSAFDSTDENADASRAHGRDVAGLLSYIDDRLRSSGCY